MKDLRIPPMLKPGLVLLLVAAIAALILGGVSLATSGRIETIAEEKMTNAMQTVLPAASYAEVAVPEGYSDIDAIYAAANGGWVVQATESGSQGLVTMMVGVDAGFVCTGVSITESSETAGLGAIAGQASEKGDAFRAQFVGQSGAVAVTKENGSIDAISGATITSKAVCRGVTSALAVCRELGGTAPAVTVVEGPAPGTAPVTIPNTEPAAPAATLPSAEPAAPSVPAAAPSGEPSAAPAG